MAKAKLLFIISILSPFVCFTQDTQELVDSISPNFIITVGLKKDSIIDKINFKEEKNKTIYRGTLFKKQHRRSPFGATGEFNVILSAQTLEEKTPYFKEKGGLLMIELNGGAINLRSFVLFEDDLINYLKSDATSFTIEENKHQEIDSVNSFFGVKINYFLDTSVRCIKIFEKVEEPTDFVNGEEIVIRYGVNIDFEKYKKNKEICINIFKNYTLLRKIFIRKEDDEYYYKRMEILN